MREFRSLLNEYEDKRPRFSVGEIHIFDWKEWATYYGKELDGLHMPFNFSLLFAPWNPQTVQSLVEAVEAAVPPGAWPNYVLGNHDEHRIASRRGPDATRMCMMLLLTLRGTPTVYYGDELGMQDVAIPPEMEQDPWGKRVQGFGVGRDPERTPMQWDDSANAGFSGAGIQTWLPVGPDYAQVNVAAQLNDPASMLNFTRKLLALRRATPALNTGDYQSVHQGNADCLVYQRRWGDDRWLVTLNFSGQPQTVSLPGGGSARLALSTNLEREGHADLSNLTLRPNEGILLHLR
jgi:alpha-glucosidase